jgi:DNA helicase-2/ATP-dependent DNA helicase PcrA
VRGQIGDGGLDATATALDRWSHGAIAAHFDDLDALNELAELEPDPGRFPGWLADRLATGRSARGVTLASIHAVKGREWPYVVLHHVSAGLLPHRLSPDLEEERRIFHVGLTRAIRSATVVTGTPPSPMVPELEQPGTPAPRPPRPPAAQAAPAAGSTRDRRTGSHARSRSASGPPAAEVLAAALLAADPGTVFTSGGQELRVVEPDGDGVMCLIGEGPGRTRIRYGTTVTHQGRTSVLAHPGAPAALERLRAWRTQKAKDLKVPAYVVFDDTTIRLLALQLPVTEAGLLSVRGIGPAKLEAYGSELMAITESARQGG